MCEDMVFLQVPNTYWDSVKVDSLGKSNLWERGEPGRPARMTAQGELPVTYFFKTREGGIGVLQITGFNENPKGVRIRYKLLHKSDVQAEVTEPTETRGRGGQ